MELRLRLYPDPVLLRPAKQVTVFDDELAERVAEMHRIMYAEKGVGLAAPQVGWSVQVLVLNPEASADETESAMTIINPRVVKKWGKHKDQEGCLSFPEIFVDVQRAVGVRLAWQDEHGEEHEQDFTEFLARIIQHEQDHLEGVLLFHRMGPLDRFKYRHDLEQLVEDYEESKAAASET